MMSYQYKFQDEDQTKVKGSIKYVFYLWLSIEISIYTTIQHFAVCNIFYYILYKTHLLPKSAFS